MSVSNSVLSGMKDLQRQIRRKQVDSLRQAILQDYNYISVFVVHKSRHRINPVKVPQN